MRKTGLQFVLVLSGLLASCAIASIALGAGNDGMSFLSPADLAAFETAGQDTSPVVAGGQLNIGAVHAEPSVTHSGDTITHSFPSLYHYVGTYTHRVMTGIHSPGSKTHYAPSATHSEDTSWSDGGDPVPVPPDEGDN